MLEPWSIAELGTCIDWAGRGIFRHNPHDLPSWIPDLSRMDQPTRIYQDGDGPKLGPGGQFQLDSADIQQYSKDEVLSVYGVALITFANTARRKTLAVTRP